MKNQSMDDLRRKTVENLMRLDKEKTMLQFHLREPRADGKVPVVSKDIEISENARNEGNTWFVGKNHDAATHFKILHMYNKSVAYAPSGSEQLAAAYGNRSALLRHIRKYAESICEADKALKITKAIILQIKLLCRKADCYTALGSPENKKCLEKARLLLDKAKEPEEKKKVVSDLIMKTQKIVDANKMDKPKEDKRMIEVKKMTADAEKNDVWESVKIEYSEKYGKHVVAARDFEPGEIVLVEKPYFNQLDDSALPMYCSHCFHYLWTLVSCDHCAWRLFCSEECRDEAMNEYHDMECSVLIQMKENYILTEHHFVAFLIGVFSKAFKEAGSISQLQVELQAVDDCEDECRKGFSSDGKFGGYQSIYAQPLRHIDNEFYESYSMQSTIALVGLARYSKIFGRRYTFNEIKKLLKNETAIFVGALILKLSLVIWCRLTSMRLNDPSSPPAVFNDITHSNVSSALKLLGLLPIMGCAPNVKNCAIIGNRHLLYSLQPIKKGSPLITSMCSIYDSIPKLRRQAIYRNYFSRPCECQACTEDWLKGGLLDKLISNLLIHDRRETSSNLIVEEIEEEIYRIKKTLGAPHRALSNIDLKLILRTRDVVVKCWRHFPMPATITHDAISLMASCYDGFFSPVTCLPNKMSQCTY